MPRRCRHWHLGGGCPPCPWNTNIDCWVVPKPPRKRIQAWVYPDMFGNIIYKHREKGTIPCTLLVDWKDLETKK